MDSNSDISDPDPYFVPIRIRTPEKKSNPDPDKPGSETMISTQNEKGAQEQKGTPNPRTVLIPFAEAKDAPPVAGAAKRGKATEHCV